MGWCEIEIYAIILSLGVVALLALIGLSCVSSRRQGGTSDDLLSSRSSGHDRMLIRTYNDDDCTEPTGGGFLGSGSSVCLKRFTSVLFALLCIGVIVLGIYLSLWVVKTTLRPRANILGGCSATPPTTLPECYLPNTPSIYPPPPPASLKPFNNIPKSAQTLRCNQPGVSFKGVVARSTGTAPKISTL
jgi:hypothetical protein